MTSDPSRSTGSSSPRLLASGPQPRRRALAAVAVLALATVAAGCESTYGPGARFVPAGRRGRFREPIDVSTFQRGNVHTHSRESDGDHPPEDVYAWYRDHGYNFLALTDHNKLTDPRRYREVERPGFVIIHGEELTLRGGGNQVHVNALCHRRRIGGRRFRSVEEALRWGVQRTRQEGGIALVNHPNFYWAFGAESLPAAQGATMLEIWSGHPKVNPEGDWRHPSVESMWDQVLSSGMDLAGTAVDDTHHLEDQQDLRRAGPGRGWIDVFAHQANEHEICTSMSRGHFIASNGVRLSRLTVNGDTFTVLPQAPGGTVEWIGHGGSILARQRIDPWGRNPVRYRLRGGEDYVRARITATNGSRAWTQAYRVEY